MRTFWVPLTILNTLDSLGKFDGKSDEGYLLGYSTSSKTFKVYNKRTKRVEENLHIDFLEDQSNVARIGPNWMFDLDFLTNTMNYIPVSVENQVNVDAGTQDSSVAGSSGKDKEPTREYILLPLHPHRTRILVEDMSEDEQVLHDELEKMIAQEVIAKALDDATRQAFEEEKRNIASQKRAAQASSINKLSINRSYVIAASTPISANVGESSFVYLGRKIPIDASTLPNADLPIDPNMPDLEDDFDAFSNDGIFNGAYDDENVGAVADFNNMDATINVSPIPTLKIHKDHPKDQILGDPNQSSKEKYTRGFFSITSIAGCKYCMKICEFKLQKVWILVDLPSGKKAIGTKWEEGIDYEEVFAHVARIEAIRLFLAFASYMGFTVYQMDVKNAFLYSTIEEEVYVHQPPCFVDPAHPNKVYKVIKALYGLHQAPRAWTVKKQDADKPNEGTAEPNEGTAEPNEGTAKPNEGTTEPKDGNSDESAAPTTVFRDDETIAQFLVTISQNKTKQKGFEIKEIKDTDRPRTTTKRSILTLKPLSKIDPKDKGKKVLEEKAESDVESEGVNEAEKKFKMLDNDEEIARKVQEEWEAKEEMKKLAEEEATKAAFTNEYDFIQARLNADKILAEKLQKEEREKFTIEQRAKFLHDTIAAQRRFLAQQRSEAIRNNQMMTYLKYTDSDHEEENQLRTFLKIVPEEEENINYEVPGTRMDLVEIHSLVMKRFETTPLEGIDLLLWRDLRIMFESKEDDELWKNQEE
ncbi:putative ribonuclease H-like domain-containing protein [Tanacetum coccineum]